MGMFVHFVRDGLLILVCVVGCVISYVCCLGLGRTCLSGEGLL